MTSKVKLLLLFLLLSSFSRCNLSTDSDNKKAEEAKMKLLWEILYEPVGLSITSTPLLIGDSLVIMSAGQEIWAIEQTNGNVRWKAILAEQTNIQTDEFKTDGRNVYATHIQDVRAWSLATGELKWITDLSQERGGLWDSPITLNDGKLFVGGDQNAYCLNTNDGSILWTKHLQDRGVIGGSVVYGSHVIFGGSYGFDDTLGNLAGGVGKLYALNIANGDTVWTAQTMGDGEPQSLVLDGGTIFTGTHFAYSNSSFDALDATNGKTIWTYYTPNQGWDYNHSILVADKIIANAGWYHVAAFDKSTGALLWRTFIANDAESRKLHYHGGYVYHTQGWRLFVIDPKDGRIVFSLKPQGKDLVTIAVGNGRVFVCGYPTLQCYEAYKP